MAVLATLGIVAAATMAALALDSGEPAGAVGLVRFESCEAIEDWAEDLTWEMSAAGRAGGVDFDVVAAESAPTASDGSGADTGASATGGTNTVVAGVDEVDVIDRVSDEILLVSTYGTLSLVDLDDRTRVATLTGIAPDARISYDDGVAFAVGSSPDGMGTQVQRVRVDGESLSLDGTWTTTGYLLDARRSGDRLHVVVVESPGTGVVPFAEGPVACDQVWRPVAPASTAAATLVASFEEDGELAPVAAAEVAGSAGNVLVTGSALYVTTESWDAVGEASTGIHRFALGSLAPTGSGTVSGTVAGPFAMSEDGDHLRVATHLGGGVMVVDDCPNCGGGAPEPAIDQVRAEVATPVQGDDEATTTTEPDTTTTTEPDTTTTTEPETTTTTEPAVTTSSTTEPETTTTSSTSTTTSTVPAAPDALAEVFVLDLDGALDVVGRTGRFGHDYETIQGVRFLGDVAYVVTFRQTDPFFVTDLADPAAPRVVGELQIPGFSAYLHPAGEDRVVGFGPDGTGAVSARLFDVSDPAAPTVIDEVRLGDESTVVWDHHAFDSLGGTRFAVPVTDWLFGGDGGGAGAVVLDVDGGRLTVVDRAMVTGIDLTAERVVQAPDGIWLVLGYGRLVGTDGSEVPIS